GLQRLRESCGKRSWGVSEGCALPHGGGMAGSKAGGGIWNGFLYERLEPRALADRRTDQSTRLKLLLRQGVSGRRPRMGQPVAQAAKAATVACRRQPHAPGEQATEVAGVLVAALGGDRFDRQLRGLELLLGFLEPQGVDVGQRRHAGGLAEATIERALRQAAARGHRGDRAA